MINCTFRLKSIHLGVHASDNSKKLSNISSVWILKKTYMAKLLFYVKHRPAGQRHKGSWPPAVASIARRVVVAAVAAL